MEPTPKLLPHPQLSVQTWAMAALLAEGKPIPWTTALAKVMEAEECQLEEAATILKEAIKQPQASTR